MIQSLEVAIYSFRLFNIQGGKKNTVGSCQYEFLIYIELLLIIIVIVHFGE